MELGRKRNGYVDHKPCVAVVAITVETEFRFSPIGSERTMGLLQTLSGLQYHLLLGAKRRQLPDWQVLRRSRRGCLQPGVSVDDVACYADNAGCKWCDVPSALPNRRRYCPSAGGNTEDASNHCFRVVSHYGDGVITSGTSDFGIFRRKVERGHTHYKGFSMDRFGPITGYTAPCLQHIRSHRRNFQGRWSKQRVDDILFSCGFALGSSGRSDFIYFCLVDFRISDRMEYCITNDRNQLTSHLMEPAGSCHLYDYNGCVRTIHLSLQPRSWASDNSIATFWHCWVRGVCRCCESLARESLS